MLKFPLRTPQITEVCTLLFKFQLDICKFNFCLHTQFEMKVKSGLLLQNEVGNSNIFDF